jgi:hypothetical protein
MRTVINGQDVYLDGDNIPEFSYSLNELTDFTKVKGSSSTTFDIPASNGARVGLGGVAMQEQPIGEVPIRIGEGGQVLFEGVCVPTEWTDESIKVVAYGDNATWFDRAKSTKCVDVDLGNTGAITTASIVNTWVAEQADLQAQLISRSHFYPVIDYGSMGAYASTTNITLGKIRWAASVRALLQKFFNDAGYSVTINGRLSNLWNRLMLPSAGHTYKAVNNTATIYAASDGVVNPFDVLPSVINTLGEVSNLFILPSSGTTAAIRTTIDGRITVAYSIRLRYTVFFPDEQPQMNLFILDGLNILVSRTILLPNAQGVNEVTIEGVLDSVSIVANTQTLVVTGDFVDTNGPSILEGSTLTYTVNPVNATDIYDGVTYSVSSAIAPSLSVADVISSLATMLRLVITTNQLTNEVTFQHYDDYLLDPSEGVDWSDRLSHNTLPAKVRPETPERFVFKYADDDKDERLFNYNDETNWTAEGVYDTDGRDEEKVSTLKFAATQQGERFGSATVPVIKEVDKVIDYVKCKPRILVHGGFTTSAATVMTFAGAARTYCPRFYFAGSGGNDINIGFGNDAGRLGTLERFWRASLIRAVKPYLKGEFRVYDDEFMNFEFARPRLVNDGYGNVWMYVQVVKGKKFGDDDLVDCELIPV